MIGKPQMRFSVVTVTGVVKLMHCLVALTGLIAVARRVELKLRKRRSDGSMLGRMVITR